MHTSGDALLIKSSGSHSSIQLLCLTHNFATILVLLWSWSILQRHRTRNNITSYSSVLLLLLPIASLPEFLCSLLIGAGILLR